MASKVSSALLAADAGVPVLLAPATNVATALTDASVGTVFAPRPALRGGSGYGMPPSPPAG
ncbi:hypothetical protein NIIDMKKI_20990 [Mycobacterium kansasii]|uniref:Uncharacterized protein n=1 Tax=Mycobacterium kansasii TaxID=1768 RepID=A0A7G1I9A5_MYCKA|nr:hypothetical protein NIIDMKKI_20990 [Mycobacterium kansasii]